MRTPRRFLPGLHFLAAFETAARTESVTAAAQELDLTQGAVSRQIRALEDLLGVELFNRQRQTIRLNHAGKAYARDIRDALQKISTASLNLRANPAGGSLTLAILPTFGTRWLAPRLPGFLSAHTGITLNLVTQLRPFDFANETIDAAIHFGDADWPGGHCAFLMEEDVIPACAPALRDSLALTRPEDMRRAPLLHLTSRPDAWEQWFAHQKVEASNVHGMLFDQFATLAQAAVAGLGVALLPRFLFEEELALGKLVPALEAPMRSPSSYYLCWPEERADYPPLQAFRGWLEAEAKA